MNLLIIFSDQLRADALGCYGNRTVSTPALDSLAATGTVYDSAFTPCPVCVPARSSLITGLEPQHGECFENQMPMSSESTFMDALTEAGYRTHGVGKMHFTPDAHALRGFQTRDTGEEFGTADDDDYLAFVAEQGFDFVEHPHGLRDEMYYIPQLSPVPEPLHHSHWVADRSIDFLREQSSDRPFLLWSSFIAPHPPFAPPSPWHRRYEPSTMTDPFVPPSSSDLLTVYNHLQNRYKYRDGGRDRRLNQLLKAYYFASVSYLDSQVGRILRALDESGLRDETTIIVTADHGELLGDYGSFGKRSFLDASARIPFIVSGPGFKAERKREVVSLLDVYPTVLELAGIEHPERDGSDLQDLPPERAFFGQYQEGELGLYAVITDRWKYIWSAFDKREYLLDRVRDPDETMNLAYNVRRRADLLSMRALALEHFEDLRDADLDSLASNSSLRLGERPSPEAVRAMQALGLDRDAATLVVRGGAWTPPSEAWRDERLETGQRLKTGQ
ncbi:sulfatase [Sinomonas gamaensis]|uniref:sulfatase family protein n=1 Tax=Sinomonas gamaensis TaxID=2565624 RepID=UPI001487544A|nr:sulfatase-like hydrolase/transferase [Sinomonas gamaensis]